MVWYQDTGSIVQTEAKAASPILAALAAIYFLSPLFCSVRVGDTVIRLGGVIKVGFNKVCKTTNS